MHLSPFLAISALALSAAAAPTINELATTLPLLKLPYATYSASYNTTNDIYTFSNVRFAAPPTGSLRFAAPAAPIQEVGINTGATQGFGCMQATPPTFPPGTYPTSEDCLFLDVVVPGAAIRGTKKDLPVAYWMHGGGYAFGSKNDFVYDGSVLVVASNSSIIYVKSNYRLGAFGFLNGPTVEAQAETNVGLLDQRAALQWIQSYIHLVNGDKTQVTAFGESAGGGSIYQHLVARGGTQDPLFSKAIAQSPAYKPTYDPGMLQTQYVSFANQAGCPGNNPTIACLRSLSTAQLQAGNLEVSYAAGYGDFAFQPAVDNDYLQDIFQVEFLKGKYWKNVELMIGHNIQEGLIFANPAIATDAEFDAYIYARYPNASAFIHQTILELYPPPSVNTTDRYTSEFGRVSQLIAESLIVCNARLGADAYLRQTYNYLYSDPPGVHAQDLAYTYYFPGIDTSSFLPGVPSPSFPTLKNSATAFQSYLVSFMLKGNPNTFKQVGSNPPASQFTMPGTGATLNVLNVNATYLGMIPDTILPLDRCLFWNSGVYTGRDDI